MTSLFKENRNKTRIVNRNCYVMGNVSKLPANDFKWAEDTSSLNEKFKKIHKPYKNYDEDSDKGYILEVNVEYPKNLHDLHSGLPFLPQRTKMNKVNKLVSNLYDKKNYVVQKRDLKQALNHGLILKEVHKVIQFTQKACLKEYIDVNTKLRREAKNDFEEDFFELMNNSVFGKTLKNVRNKRDIK